MQQTTSKKLNSGKRIKKLSIIYLYLNIVDVSREAKAIKDLYRSETFLLDIRQKNEFYHIKPFNVILILQFLRALKKSFNTLFKLDFNITDFELSLNNLGNLVFVDSSAFESSIDDKLCVWWFYYSNMGRD